MKKNILLVICLITSISYAQQTQYNVTPGNGNGLRFWNSNHYKIHMGSTPEYKFGPVTDYSIKMNMSTHAGRGWTWGVLEKTPVAALSNVGDFKIAGNMTTTGYVSTQNPNNSLASVSLSWLNDIARLRVGGVDAGASNGFDFQGPGDRSLLRIMGNGNIGIGTTNPGTWKLNVQGHVNIGGNGNYHLQTRHVNGKSATSAAIDNLYLNYNSNKHVFVGYGSKAHSNLYVFGNIRNGGADLQLGVHDGRDQGTRTSNRALVHNTGDRLYLNYAGDFEGGTYIDGPKTIFTSGNVGIGTTIPDARLTVKGKIHAEEVKIDLSVPAPDYVFKNDYSLLSIKEVEKHIKENGHLPNIPSAEVMENDGVALGIMNMKLLEKIEELTLYTIAQQKEIELLKNQNSKIEILEKKLNELLERN